MSYSNITMGLENLTFKNIVELERDLEVYKMLETNPEVFLKMFFRPNIESSLFITQIKKFSEKAMWDFQENILIHTEEYFKKIIGIDGIEIKGDIKKFPLVLSVYKLDIELVKIYIYDKKVVILENCFFEDIYKDIETLEKRKALLLEEYNKYYRYSVNSMEMLKDDTDMKFIKTVDIAISSLRKNKNKYKMESNQKCLELEEEINSVDIDIEDLLSIEQDIRKNLLSISYYQSKISDRLNKYLNYNIYKD